MAGLFDKQAEIYAKRRPRYPEGWFSIIAALTAEHKRVWDAGTGSGQAAVSIAEHYEQVIATDVSEAQLNHAIQHPKVQYLHTPIDASEDDLVAMLGGKGSIDLVTAAAAVHWFDFQSFYSVVNRVLKKPGGVIVVWSYNYEVHPFEDKFRLMYEAVRPYMDPRVLYAIDRYKTLPFPFESVGMGSEGHPVDLDMDVEMSLDDVLEFPKTSSVATTARAKGVDLVKVTESVAKEIEREWGKSTGPRKLTYKAFMLAGKPKC